MLWVTISLRRWINNAIRLCTPRQPTTSLSAIIIIIIIVSWPILRRPLRSDAFNDVRSQRVLTPKSVLLLTSCFYDTPPDSASIVCLQFNRCHMAIVLRSTDNQGGILTGTLLTSKLQYVKQCNYVVTSLLFVDHVMQVLVHGVCVRTDGIRQDVHDDGSIRSGKHRIALCFSPCKIRELKALSWSCWRSRQNENWSRTGA